LAKGARVVLVSEMLAMLMKMQLNESVKLRQLMENERIELDERRRRAMSKSQMWWMCSSLIEIGRIRSVATAVAVVLVAHVLGAIVQPQRNQSRVQLHQ